jgi:transcriptional regulator with XRE-family HTH domain
VSQSTFFPQRLRALRDGRRWTRPELAEKIGVHANTIYNWENGIFSPSLDDLQKISGALNVSLEELQRGDVYSLHEEEGPGDDRGGLRTRADCERYLSQFLDTLDGDPAKYSWTWIELTEHFPLTKFKKDKP